MANTRFSVNCPSCEAKVTILSTAQIGKKTECPKCKFRFTVPDPDDVADGDDQTSGKKKSKKKQPEKKKGASPLIYIGVGVLALLLLGVAGFFILGGNDENRPNTNTTNTPVASNQAMSRGGEVSSSTDVVREGEGGEAQPGVGSPVEETKPKEAPIAGLSGSLKDVTNLLPSETTAVYRVNFDRFNQNCTPLATAVFDAKIREIFRNAMTFGTEDLSVYIHCIVGADRDPFGVLRTKKPIDASSIYAELKLEEVPNGVIRGNKFFHLKSNAFVDAVAQAFTTQTVTKLLGITFPPPTAQELEAKNKKKYGFCLLDRQTILIGDLLIMERFLEDLQPNGYPPFKSDLTTDTEPQAPPTTGGQEGEEGGEGRGQPGSRGLPGAAAGAPTPFSSSFTEGTSATSTNFQGPAIGPVRGAAAGIGGPGGPGGPPPGIAGGPPGEGGEAPRRKLFTSIPTYRTIDPPLKKMLNELEEETASMGPAIVYAERLDQRIFNGRAALEGFRQTGDGLLLLIARTQMVGASFTTITKDRMNAKIAMEYITVDDARRTIGEIIEPNLKIFAPVIDLFMGSQTTVRTQGGGGGGGRGGDPFGSEGGFGGASDSGGGGRGGPPPPGVPGGPPPGIAGPGGPGGFGPGGFGGSNELPSGLFASSMDISLSDRNVLIDIAMKWQEERFNDYLRPQIARITSMLKGRMSVLTGEVDWHRLAAVSPKLQQSKKLFPRGTLERETSDNRYRLPYPPEHRVSFFAELLPYIGQGPLRSQIQDRKKPWYDKDNLSAAEAWVPEFLVPYYPQDTWRAQHPLAPGKQLGGTNYVAPAGVGLDSVRYNPANPEHAKKIGITGYDWGSKFEDIKDGLSNTIYILQTAPGTPRPWIVGGGSTVVGISDGPKDPLAPFVHKVQDGARGTYALMADGSVRFLKEGTDPNLFRALVTRAGGETIADLDKTTKLIPPPRPAESELRGGPTAKLPAKEPKETTEPAELNPDDLKRLQGNWRVTFDKSPKGKLIPKQVRDATQITVIFEQNIVRIKVVFNGNETVTPPQEIIKLDFSAKPNIIDTKEESGKISYGVFELSGNRLKIRANEKQRPTRVSVPDDKSEDEYLELEKIE